MVIFIFVIVILAHLASFNFIFAVVFFIQIYNWWTFFVRAWLRKPSIVYLLVDVLSLWPDNTVF